MNALVVALERVDLIVRRVFPQFDVGILVSVVESRVWVQVRDTGCKKEGEPSYDGYLNRQVRGPFFLMNMS